MNAQRAVDYTDVFVAGGFPRHTYNPRVDLQLEKKLGEATQNLCKLVTVTGHTKSGKTVLARKVFPPAETVWVDGGTVASEDDFWGAVLEQLEAFQTTQTSAQDARESSYGGKVSASADLIVASGSGDVNGSNKVGHSTGGAKSRTVSARVAALHALREAHRPLIVDDFHYLPNEQQGSIVRALKPLVFDGLPAVIIAIPHRRYDAMKVEREMTGRIYPIQIPVWSEAELAFIPETGFSILNYQLRRATADELVKQAIGSPHLVQDFCRTLCRLEEIEPNALTLWGRKPIELDLEDLHAVFSDVAETIGRPIFEKLARGPRQRTDRMERGLKDGRKVDIYEVVLYALAHLKPGLISLEYEELRAAIREVSAPPIPQLHEVARVLKHMATIAATDQSSTPVIDFEEAEKKLHITDPFFAFFLRWGKLDK